MNVPTVGVLDHGFVNSETLLGKPEGLIVSSMLMMWTPPKQLECLLSRWEVKDPIMRI